MNEMTKKVLGNFERGKNNVTNLDTLKKDTQMHSTFLIVCIFTEFNFSFYL